MTKYNVFVLYRGELLPQIQTWMYDRELASAYAAQLEIMSHKTVARAWVEVAA